MRGRRTMRRRRRREAAMVVLDPIAAVGGRRVPPAQIPPVPTVPAAVFVVPVDVVADERVGDAVENVGEERVRCGERRRRHDGCQSGAEHNLSSCQHVDPSRIGFFNPDALILLNICSGRQAPYILQSVFTFPVGGGEAPGSPGAPHGLPGKASCLRKDKAKLFFLPPVIVPVVPIAFLVLIVLIVPVALPIVILAIIIRILARLLVFLLLRLLAFVAGIALIIALIITFVIVFAASASAGAPERKRRERPASRRGAGRQAVRS